MQYIIIQLLADGLQSLEDHSALDVFMRPVREAAPDWARTMRAGCNGVDDLSYLELGVGRVLGKNESGREYFQTARGGGKLKIGRSAYLDLFQSERCLGLLKDVAAGLYRDGCRLGKVDALAEFHLLDGLEVMAGDGHLPEFLQNTRRCRPAARGTILLLDMAFGDAPFWSRMKLAGKAGAAVILPLKSNIKPIIFENRDFDRNDPVNTGVLSVDLVTFNHPDSSTMRRVLYRDPETGTEHVFITTEMDLPPGLIAFLYLLRWRIEKVFDVLKNNKFHEKKAWGNTTNCQQVQTHFACLTHNLILLLAAGRENTYGIGPGKLIKKREKELARRESRRRKRKDDQPAVEKNAGAQPDFVSIHPVSPNRPRPPIDPQREPPRLQTRNDNFHLMKGPDTV